MPNSHARSSLLPNTLLICLTFLLLSSSATAALSDYSESSDSAPESPCIKDSTYDCAKCGCDFDPTGGGFNVAFSCLTVMALLVTIAGYISVKEMREAPGDIVFGLCVSDFVLSLEWIVQGGLRLKYNQTLSPSSDGCVALSYLDVIFNLLSNFYNIIFFAFFFMATRTSLKITRIPQYLYHVIPILGTVIGVIVTYAQDLFGMSMYGICSFEESNDYFLPVLIIVIFTVFPFITAYAVKKSLPECKRLSSVRFQFLQYYLIYVFTASFFDVASSISSLFLIDEVNKMIQNPYYTGNPTLAIIFGNVFRVFRPLTLAIIRLYDPNIRKHWPKIIPCLRRRGKSTMKISMLGEVQKEDFDGRHRIVSLSFLEMQENLKNTPFLNQIQHTVRVQVLYSLLSSIHFYWRMSKKTQLLSYKTATDGFQIDYKKMAKITEQIKISDGMIKKEMPEMMREISIKDYKGIEGVLTVHAPGIFREIIETDGKSDYLSISLDLTANYNRIIKAGINNGGKSGEFFFFSYDNSLVIKTISNEELKTLLEILPMYSQHFKSNPKSLIAKIYGVFTFKRIEPYEMYNLILMKNVNGLPSECVERKYDLKGSTYGRVTIKSGNPQLSELKYFDTLKDIDFLKFEKKLNIEPCLRETLLRTLKADSEFLRKNNLIDYSLVVYVLKKVVKPINRSDSEISIVASSTDQADPRTYAGRSYFLYDSSVSDESQSPRPQQRARSLVGGVEPSFSRESVLHEMRSTTEDNVFYHVGVIDYLIKYNMKKRLEKFGKKLLACNPKLDISVQSPQFYAQRFRDYMEKIIS